MRVDYLQADAPRGGKKNAEFDEETFNMETSTSPPILRPFRTLDLNFAGEAIYTLRIVFRLILHGCRVISNAIVSVALLFIVQLRNNPGICEKYEKVKGDAFCT